MPVNMTYVDNILAVFNSADAETIRSGLMWYPRAHDFALSLDNNVSRAAAVIAVISPNTSWKANQTLALKAYNNMSGAGIGFPDKVQKVERLFSGERPDTVVRGPKVTAFYERILYPDSDYIVPVIDRHAQDIADGIRSTEKKRKPPKGIAYRNYALAYMHAAGIVGICSSQLQAITWEEWRKRHGINY